MTAKVLRVVKIICVVCIVITLSFSQSYAAKRATPRKPAQVSSEGAVLPKKGDIAVIVEGPEQFTPKVESFMIDTLVKRGYRVVDEAKMRKIRLAAARAQAARLALYGEEHKIMQINASYNVAATVIVKVTPEQAKENPFGLVTATASASVLAVRSNGIKLGGKTSSSKKVGYTEIEAMRKAVDEAVQNGIEQIF